MIETINLTNLPEFIGSPDVEIDGLKVLSILFGKNGSGKSLFLRKIAEMYPKNSHYCNPEKAGTFSYQANLYESESNATTRLQRRRTNLNENYYQQSITRIQSFLTKRGAWIEGNPPVSHLDIQDLIHLLLPDYDIKIVTENPYLHVKNQSGNSIPLDDLSSGERHILGLGLDIASICAIWSLENTKDCLLLVDEPDAHLHPDLHQNFSLFIKNIAEKFSVQIIISTHSSTLLAALGHYFGNKASVIYLKKGGSTHKALPLSDIQKELASILGGHALMGPLFSVPLLLVEGDDDYRIWSQVPRHHKFSFSVIPCNGEEIYKFQKALETIFASMLSASTSCSGYALIDQDKNLPDPKTTPQNHIKFIQLKCHESENLYLTNNVLKKLGIDWEQAKEAIISKASTYGAKKTKLESAKSWDKKNEDIKNLINEISEILDSKKVHWTTRLGQTLGCGEITGELAEFLGEDIVNSILKQST